MMFPALWAKSMPCPSYNPMSPIVSSQRHPGLHQAWYKKTVSSRGGYRLSYCWFSEESGNSRQFAATSHKSKSCDSRAEQNQGIPTIGNLVGSDNRSPLFIAS